MRARLILLLILCGILLTLQALPADAIQAAATGKSLIWIDLSAMSLTLYQNQQQVGYWPIAAGASDTPTPLGVYYIAGGFRVRYAVSRTFRSVGTIRNSWHKPTGVDWQPRVAWLHPHVFQGRRNALSSGAKRNKGCNRRRAVWRAWLGAEDAEAGRSRFPRLRGAEEAARTGVLFRLDRRHIWKCHVMGDKTVQARKRPERRFCGCGNMARAGRNAF